MECSEKDMVGASRLSTRARNCSQNCYQLSVVSNLFFTSVWQKALMHLAANQRDWYDGRHSEPQYASKRAKERNVGKYMDETRNRPIAIDLFSGAGGLSEGLLSAGIQVVAAVEKHPHAALTCAFNHPSTSVICDDICRLSMKLLEDVVFRRTGQRKVDIVAGGPPCQGFSPAGLRNPDDPRNSLFKQFVRVVKHFQPRVILFENVPGFARQYDGSAAKAVTSMLRKLGYDLFGMPDSSDASINEFSLLDAANYGVPQHRKRFVLVGCLSGEIEREFSWMPQTHGTDVSDFVTAGDAISDLEFLVGGKECHIYIHEPQSTYQAERRMHASTLFNHLATDHRSSTVEMYKNMGKPGASIRSVPKDLRSGKQTMSRLNPDRCSKVILALPDDIVHYCRHRIPTVREMARLQSFDDSFVFLGKRTTSDKNRRIDVPQYTQVGNAVPPLLARAIGISILNSLGYRPKELRNLREREKRHKYLCGSSGFKGYTISEKAQNSLDITDSDGNPIALPLSVFEPPASSIKGIVRWKRTSCC